MRQLVTRLPLPVLVTCCCWFTIKTGTMIIGVLNTFLSGSLLVIYSFISTKNSTEFHNEIILNYYFRGFDIEDIILLEGSSRLIILVQVVLSASEVILSALLILGTIKNKPSLLRAWILGFVVILTFNTLISCMQAVLFMLAGSSTVYMGLAAFASGAIKFGITAYCLAVVRSHYMSIIKSNHQFPALRRVSIATLEAQYTVECGKEGEQPTVSKQVAFVAEQM